MQTYIAPAVIAADPITRSMVSAMHAEPGVSKHRIMALGDVFYPSIAAVLGYAADMVQPEGYPGFPVKRHTGPFFAGLAAVENYARGGRYLGNMAALENWLANGGARAQMMAVQQITGALYTGWPVSQAFPLDLTAALVRVAGNLYA